MKEIIQIFAVIIIAYAIILFFSYNVFNSKTTVKLSSTPKMSSMVGAPLLFGDANTEDDGIDITYDDVLINDFRDIDNRKVQCSAVKNMLKKSLQKIRQDVLDKKDGEMATLSACKIKIPQQVAAYKKLYKARFGKEPTDKEINDNAGFIPPELLK